MKSRRLMVVPAEKMNGLQLWTILRPTTVIPTLMKQSLFFGQVKKSPGRMSEMGRGRDKGSKLLSPAERWRTIAIAVRLRSVR
jgi:hypothetical protein